MLELIMENRRIFIKNIANETCTGTVHKIIHDELKLKKICSRWVPRLLTKEMRESRMEACSRFLK